MGQARNRREEIANLKATGKSTLDAVRNLGMSVGYSASQMKGVWVSESGQPTIDFTSIDAGYEDFITALRSIGFNWEDFKHIAGVAYIHFVAGKEDNPTRISQLAGNFPATLTCENGAPLEEFAVAAGFFSIIEQSFKHLQKQVTRKLCVPMLRYERGVLHFVVMPA